MKRRFVALALAGCLALMCAGCEYVEQVVDVAKELVGGSSQAEEDTTDTRSWQQTVSDAVAADGGYAVALDDGVRSWYEVLVNAFCDSDADSAGDFAGLASQLDYIRYMGFNGLCLMPVFPSPSYDKYDVTDYTDVDAAYGTMNSFSQLIAGCRSRGIRVILDLPIRYTASQHAWFTRAVQALQEGDTKSAVVGYYYFSEEDGGEGWYPAAEGWYYRAGHGEAKPDLDLSNAGLRTELEKVMGLWLGKGVSGFRVDVLDDGEEAADGNADALEWIVEAVKEIDPDAYVVAVDRSGAGDDLWYYGTGVDSLTNAPFAGASGVLANTVQGAASARQYGQAVVDRQAQMAENSETGTDAPYFTTHDTDRAADVLAGNENQIKLAWGMNLLQGGNSFLYYGEEIGMSGSGSDAARQAPMYWSATPGIFGVTIGAEGAEKPAHAFGPVKEQIEDDSSILQVVRKANSIGTRYPAIARGQAALVEMGGALGMTKTWGDQSVLVVYNTGAESLEATVPAALGTAALGDWLSAGGGAVSLVGGTLSMPGYSIAVLEIPLQQVAETADSEAA